MKASEKLEEARGLFKDLFEDLDGIMQVAELTIPMVEATVEKADLRLTQIQRLFGLTEEKK